MPSQSKLSLTTGFPLRLKIALDSGRPLPLRLKIVLEFGRPQQWSKLNLDWPRVVEIEHNFELLYNVSGKNKTHFHINVPFQLFRVLPLRKNSLWKNLCGKKCDPVFPIANACAVLSHERLFRCVGFPLHWHSQDRAATSRRNRVQ